MKTALLQYSPEWENVNANIGKIDGMLTAFNQDFDILVLPEMTLTGFTMKANAFAEEIDGAGFSYFLELSAKLKKHIFAGIIERDGNDIYNSLFHFDSGLLAARYRKIHPYSHAGEDKNYAAGKETVITKIDRTKIGLSICYDLRFPELYRHYAKERCEVMIDIANWPVQRIDHWKTLLKSRAIENQAFMIGVNRTGTDPFNTYNGCSAVFGPLGEEIIMSEGEEKILVADLNLSQAETVRQNLPFLQDMKMI